MSILSIVRQAKEEFLRDGDYMPRLLLAVKGENNYLAAKLPKFPEMQEECIVYLFHAGRKVGSVTPHKELTSACLVCTIVSSEEAQHEAEVQSASDRQESLAILQMDARVSEDEQTIHMVKIVRNKGGKVIDLLPDETPHQHASPHLPAFWFGYVNAEKPIDEIMEGIALMMSSPSRSFAPKD